MQAAARAGDAHAVAESDARFHERLLEIGDNRTLHTVWSSLEPFLRTYITLVVPGADPQWSADLHAPVMAALQRRHTEGAVAALTEHFIEASDNLARRWLDDETGSTDAPAAGDSSAAAKASPTIGPRGGDQRLTGRRPVSIIDNR
jgi:DNA-binding GntR family transcriptional regulator